MTGLAAGIIECITGQATISQMIGLASAAWQCGGSPRPAVAAHHATLLRNVRLLAPEAEVVGEEIVTAGG